jgi:hypothetical protein
MALNLAVIALGIGVAWARHRWVGLTLLLMSISYNASNALARNSGLRYLHPVDWMAYAYAAIGLLQLVIFVLLALGIPTAQVQSALETTDIIRRPRLAAGRNAWKPAILVGLVLLAVGSIPPLAEYAFPRRYPSQTQAELAAELLSAPVAQQAGLNSTALEAFLEQPEAVVVKGRAVYPRYYSAGDGEPRTAKIGYEPLDYARSLFLIASDQFYGLVMIRAEQPPMHLPNAADVLVLGCQKDQYIEANLVLVLDETPGILAADRGITAGCSEIDYVRP